MGIKDDKKEKSIKKLIIDRKVKIKEYQDAIENNRNKLKIEKEKLKEYEIALKSIQTKKSTITNVSEHAVLRYFERCLGVNINEVKQQILKPELLNIIKTMGATGTYPITLNDKEFKVVVRNNTIVTITKVN